jgi:starvation-inducible DNA-binding protein
MSITAADHHATLRHEERDALGTALQSVLDDLVDLSLAGKQLHWNVVGAGFRALHLQLDELVESVRDLADDVAERARALAWAPDGRTASVAAGSSLPAVPDGELPAHEVIKLVTALLVQAGSTTRRAAGQAAEYDAVTQDLLNQVIQTLEKHAWMFSAQGRV